MLDRFKNLVGKKKEVPLREQRDTKTAVQWVGQGRFEAQSGAISRAIDCYLNAAELEPDAADALSGLADLYLKQGKDDEALTYFQKAVEAEPTLQEAHYQMGQIHIRRRNISEAAHCFERELKVTPRSGRVHNDLAVAYFHLKDYQKAIQHADQAKALGEPVNPKFLAALNAHRR